MFKPTRKQEYERDIVSHSEAVLAEPRDPEAWTNPTYEEDKAFKKSWGRKDDQLREIGNQIAIDYVVGSYKRHRPESMRLTVGRRRV